MSLIKQIENLGIPVEEFAELTEQDIIRIEKKLKAKARMDDSLDSNDVVQIVTTLRKEKNNLAILFQEEFKPLLTLLRDENRFIYVFQTQVPPLDYGVGFSRFLSENFQEEFNIYVEKCLREDHFYGLSSLLCFSSVLSAELLEMISKRLEQRIDFMIESMRLGSERIEGKTIPATNPFFYRCLNKLGAIQFETDIAMLLNTTLEHITNKVWYVRILFAIGTFEAVNANTRDVLNRNRAIAKKAGVIEEQYPPGQLKGKGGTLVYTRPQRKPVDSKGKSSYVGLVFIVIIFFVLRTLLVSDDAPEYKMPKGFDGLSTDNTGSSNYIHTNIPTDQEFVDLMLYLHSDSIEITSQQNIHFDLPTTHLADGQTVVRGDSKSDLDIKNETEQRMVVIAQKWGYSEPLFYCLNPYQTMTVQPQLEGVRIYNGEMPQIIEYKDSNGLVKNHFRFNTFTDEDKWNFGEYHEVETIRHMSKNQLITIRKPFDKYIVDLKVITKY